MTIRDMDRRTLLKTGLMSAAAAGAATIANTASAKPAGASEMHFDVVVLGAGCAGLSAALEAADKGAKVALLDKMFGPFGNTIYAGGHFNATNTFVQKRDGLSDTLDEFYKDMMDVSMGRGDPELTRMYVEKSGECIQWLTDRVGIQWKKMHEEPWPATVRGHVVDGPKKPGGAQLTTQLLDAVKASKNITLFFNTKAIELLKTPALACTGVRAVTTKGEVIDFHAKGGVIIATGGFHNNKEMICKYMGGGVAWMPLRGAATLTGENIELTRPFFPQYVNMDQYHSGPIHGPTKANPSLMVNYGIIVNKEAQRIIDEVNTYVYIAKKLPQITPDNWAYIIIDQKVVDVSTVASRIARYKKAKAPIYEGQTIAELAKAMNVPIEALDHRRLQRRRQVWQVRFADAAQHPQECAGAGQGPVPSIPVPRRHDGNLRRSEDFQEGRGAQYRKPSRSRTLCRRQRHRRALLRRLHRRLPADRRRHLGTCCR